MGRTILLPVLAAGIWIAASEFFRNEVLLKTYWTSHYAALGLVFPSAPLNGMVWGLWSICLAACIFVIGRRFALWETVLLAWVTGFVLMWLVTGNMAVLPFGILPFAIPLSIVEVLVAALILRRLGAGPTR